MTTLVFFRKDGFYPMDVSPMPGDLPDKPIEEIARDNAECNPDTIRVEDLLGNVLWRAPTTYPPPIVADGDFTKTASVFDDLGGSW